VLVLRLLLLRQVEEFRAIHTKCLRVEVVAEVMKKFGQVLAESAGIVYPELLQKATCHQHNTVRVESSTVWFVEVVLSE
jgi:hypothetical protein